MKSIRGSTILITGVQGQVGFELVKSLGTLGAKLVLGARNPEAIRSLGYDAVNLDLSNEVQIQETLNLIKPKLIINPGAYTAVDKAESELEQAYRVNEGALRVMADALRESDGAMIHFSTDYVYNSTHDRANSEDDPTNPQNVYAASKLAGEDALQKSQIPHVILRTSWVYGTSGNNFVKTMLRLGREREQLKIVDDQVGSPTSAITLAQVVASILAQGSSDPVKYLRAKSGVYNVSDSGFTNWFEFAKEIFHQAKLLGIELKVNEVAGIKTSEYKTPASRPLNSRLDLSKIAKEFGIFTPTWQQSLGAFLYQSRMNLI